MPNFSSNTDDAIEEFLYGRINYERRADDGSTTWTFKLETVLQLLNRRGNPHWLYPVIHVAGTKGKGSVVSMIASILRAAGYRTGVYTSPHLEIVRERIAVDGELITQSDFANLIQSFQPDIEAIDRQASDRNELHPPTFFEIMTAAAFDYFAQRRVDAAVIEVGMGGRLDSTNVCRPILTAITNIGIDHQRQLGATRSLIAAEKAGIIKPGVAVICGVQGGRPADVIADVAQRHDAPIFWLGQDFRCSVPAHSTAADQTEFSTWGHVGNRYEMDRCRTSLIGRHQASNAAIAIAAAQWLAHHRWHVNETAMRAGLENVQMMGRFQCLEGPPSVVLDIAHNEISVRAFVRTLIDRMGTDSRGRTLIFSASKDKKIQRMLQWLLPCFDRVILSKLVGNPRGCELAQMEITCRRIIANGDGVENPPSIETAADSQQAWKSALNDCRLPRCIVVTGSAFLVGEMLPIVRAWSQSRVGVSG